MSNEPTANDPSESAQHGPQHAETLSYKDAAATDEPGPAQQTLGQVERPMISHAELGVRPVTLVGQAFDDLELLEELGRGGMGVVYKAKQKSLNRLVAVKLLLEEHFRHPHALARFQAEARAAASLDHPNIVQVYQTGECRLGHYFAMEYVEGRSVEDLVAKGNVPVASAVALMVVVAEAVHYAHTKGIVHRDLKPANIMVDRARRPVVMDFGIAKFVGKTSSLTQQGVIMGTPAYMAPEQAGESPDQIGPHTDVYALGCILYTLLTGRVPFEESTALRTILKVIGPDLPPAVRALRPEVPESLERLCMKCLAKKPADRVASAHLLGRELRRQHSVLTGKKGASTVVRQPSGSTMRSSRPAVRLEALATGKQINITHAVTVLGRSSECDVVLRASDVSKRHCQIIIEGDVVEVEDLGSANGTFVNGQSIQRVKVQNGDRLRVVDFEFIIHMAEPA
jgi:serine/threonine protein kinase